MMRKIRLFSLLLCMGLFFTACSDDDPAPTPDPINQPNPDPDSEVESAYLQLYSAQTPQGGIYYVRVTADDFPETIDLSSSIEVGQNAAVQSFGDNFFVTNTSASTITKWEVDRTTLNANVNGVLSFASAGISGFPRMVIVSETQAFLPDFIEGVVVEWNPEIMEIVKIHNVQAVSPQGGEEYRFNVSDGYALNNGSVVWSMVHVVDQGICCDFPFQSETPSLAVFNPSTGEIEYKSDPRLPLGGFFRIQDSDGYIYLTSNGYVGMNDNYFDFDGNPNYYVLRVDVNGDGNIDPSFEYESSSAVNIDYGGAIIAKAGNEITILYQDIDQWPESFDNRWSWWGNPDFTKLKVIDMTTNESRDFAGFADYSLGGRFLNSTGGVSYYKGNDLPEGSDVSNTQGDLLKQNAIEDFSLVTVGAPGLSVEYVSKLW